MANAGSFNITNKVIEYAAKNIIDMPGNNGQQVLVEKLLKQMENGRVILNAVIDDDGDFSTPVIKGRECAYALYDEKGHLKCGIEQAYFAGK